jgi:hypothetical protein
MDPASGLVRLEAAEVGSAGGGFFPMRGGHVDEELGFDDLRVTGQVLDPGGDLGAGVVMEP